ncbi:MAG: cobalamin-dependent protein [Candidatus Omnitrophica bacterium]|nr:cobalamin-dependent protein [Candidatus Omnitrophota bacterium]
MKITFIRPPAYGVGMMGAQLVPFLGVAYLAASARQAGHTVDIVDMCAEDIARTQIVRARYVQYGMAADALPARIKYSEVFLVTSMFSQDWVFHRELIQFLRRTYPQSIIAAGGEHVTALAGYCLQDCPELDVVALGEGDYVIPELLAAFEQKTALDKVSGIAYRAQDGRVMTTPRAARIRNIDDLPRPAWDLIPLENYLSRGLTYHVARGRTMPMLLSRGCPYKCTFCSSKNMWGQTWVARDPKDVVDEMQSYIRTYAVNNFVFSDLAAVVAQDKIIAFCQEIIDRKLDITWQSPSLRTEVLNETILRLMYDSGCRDLDFAIESASDKVLEGVGKKNDPARMAGLIRSGVRIGVGMSANMVVGLPGEGWKDVFKSYLLVLRLAVMGMHEINVFPFIPYPGSKIFEELVAKKKIILNDDYFFGLFAYADLSRPVSWSDNFGPRTLNLIRIKMMGGFYMLMWLTHPWRFVKMFINAFQGKTTTKFEGVIKRIFRNMTLTMKK